jgi:hypothetical protein
MTVLECDIRCPHWSAGYESGDIPLEPVCLRRHIFAFAAKKYCDMILRGPAKPARRRGEIAGYLRGWGPIMRKGEVE